MAGGRHALLDGYRGGLTYYDRRWQGYIDTLDCVVDMGEVTALSKVSARFLQLTGPAVYQPANVELYTSTDGIEYELQGRVPTTISDKNRMLSFQEYVFTGSWRGRYVRLVANNPRAPRGFVFTDEIVIW
jgi:hexosaminidase